MEAQTGETTKQPEEKNILYPEQALPSEEPILLKKLFPNANQDLDALFPEPSMRKLLKDLVRTRQKNERFLKGINLEKILPEEKDEAAEIS